MELREITNEDVRSGKVDQKAAIQAHNEQMAENRKVIELDAWRNDLEITVSTGNIKENSSINAYLLACHTPAELQNKIKLNTFANTIEISDDLSLYGSKIKKGQWSDKSNSILRIYLGKIWHKTFKKENLADAITKIALDHSYNPVKDYIEQEPWDGIKRAETLFIDYLGAKDTAYNRATTKITLTGGIARIYQPGIKFDTMLVLTGKQGIGKSTLLSSLANNGAWFTDHLSGMGKDKDDYVNIQGQWIVEAGELSAMSKTSIEDTKRFLSARNDKYREPYATIATEHPRQCIVFGTTNSQAFLNDLTGARRFLPVSCGINEPTKNVFKADPHDLQQVWAEAKTWYEAKEPLYLSPEMEQIANVQRENAKSDDPQADLIESFLNMKVPITWDGLSDDVKRAYFKEYLDGAISEWTKKKIETAETRLNDRTCVLEVLRVVFKSRAEEIPRGRQNGLTSKVRFVLDNMDGWKPDGNYKYRGNRRNGIKRVTQ